MRNALAFAFGLAALLAVVARAEAPAPIATTAAPHTFALDTAPPRPLVANGGFETNAEGMVYGWGGLGWSYSFRQGEGRGGTRALFYDNANPARYDVPMQWVKLETDRRYRFAVWARTEELSGNGGATICVEWRGTNGHYMGGSYCDKGIAGTKPWTKLVWTTPRIPSGAARFSVSPFVSKGMTGKAWFDDVEVVPIGPELVGLCSSAYRDIAASGAVSFHALLNEEGEGAVRKQGRCVFRYVGADGRPHEATAERGTSVTLPVGGLAFGIQRIGVAAFGADRWPFGTAEMEFTRAEALPERAVWFDTRGRAIVDGKPFFPLGMYASGINSNELAVFADGPFNCIMPYGPPKTIETMDLCLARGIKVIYSLKDIYYAKGREKEEREFVEKTVAQFKNHPALLAWYVNDERPLSMRPRLIERRELLERLDPDHPCWAVLYQVGQIQDYLPSFDVVGTDPYPIPDKSAGMAAQWTRMTWRGTRGCKPLWQVPQAFDWCCYKKKEEWPKCRPPTEAELRSMCWQCIACGANGLVLYSWFDIRRARNGSDFETRWAECRRVGDEIKRHFPVLLDDELRDYATALVDDGEPDPDGAVAVRAWRHGGENWVLAVNTSDKAIEAQIALAVDAKAASASFGPEPKMENRGRRLILPLAPLEPAFVRVR